MNDVRGFELELVGLVAKYTNLNHGNGESMMNGVRTGIVYVCNFWADKYNPSHPNHVFFKNVGKQYSEVVIENKS